MDQTTELPNDVNDRNRLWNENEVQSMRALVSDDNVIQFLLFNGRTYYPRDNTTEGPAFPSASATEEQAPPSASATEEQAPEGQKTTELPNDVNDRNRLWNEDEVQSMRAYVSDDNVIQFLLFNGRTYYPWDNTTEGPASPSASATEEQAPPSASATEEQAPEGQIPEKCCDMPKYTSLWIPD